MLRGGPAGQEGEPVAAVRSARQRRARPEQGDVVQVRHLQHRQRQDVTLEVELPHGAAPAPREAGAPRARGAVPPPRPSGTCPDGLLPRPFGARSLWCGRAKVKRPDLLNATMAAVPRRWADRPVRHRSPVERAAAPLRQVQHGVDRGQAHSRTADHVRGPHCSGPRRASSGYGGGTWRVRPPGALAAAPLRIVPGVPGQQQHIVRRVPVPGRGDHLEPAPERDEVHHFRVVQVQFGAGCRSRSAA